MHLVYNLVTYRDPEEGRRTTSPQDAEPLGSLGLNDAGDDPVDEHVPTGACLRYGRMDEIRVDRKEDN
ncbi:hypothetical protein F511_39447 [Dorcoceras hygrometricum]|uniref:Uncharacterized protein n=1 Tax=Dorcoceras hygrometricum TaxID=472368 RepID=A0A2Z7D2Q7_9LAMI|nr:hypothetical protein F511_39447 [Dorcoceras hygrometricum]